MNSISFDSFLSLCTHTLTWENGTRPNIYFLIQENKGISQAFVNDPSSPFKLTQTRCNVSVSKHIGIYTCSVMGTLSLFAYVWYMLACIRYDMCTVITLPFSVVSGVFAHYLKKWPKIHAFRSSHSMKRNAALVQPAPLETTFSERNTTALCNT